MTLLSDDEITRGLQSLPGWSLSADKTSILTSIELVDFVAALDLVNLVGREAEHLFPAWEPSPGEGLIRLEGFSAGAKPMNDETYLAAFTRFNFGSYFHAVPVFPAVV